MADQFRGRPGRGRPTNPMPVKEVANRLLELNETRLMAQLDAFIQEQLARPIPAYSPSPVIEAEVTVIDVEPVSVGSSPDQKESRGRNQNQNQLSVNCGFRRWQSEVFAEDFPGGADNEAVIEHYLSRVMEGSDRAIS